MSLVKNEILRAKERSEKMARCGICEVTEQERKLLHRMSFDRLAAAKKYEQSGTGKPVYTIHTSDGATITTTRPQRYGVVPEAGKSVYWLDMTDKILRKWQRGI